MSGKLDVEGAPAFSDNDDVFAEKQAGVVTAEAGRSVAGWTLWIGILGIALVAYIAGLDNNTMYAWQTAATTEFNDFAAYTAIGIVQQVIIAVGKFPIAKIADVFGRAQAYSVALFFWILGFIVIAVSQTTRDVAGGTVLYAIGNTGVQIMQQIVIADYISTKWRGAAIGLVSTPYIINFAIAPRIVNSIAPFGDLSTWRWGPGIFCICAPVAAAPIILALAINQTRAKKRGLVPTHPYMRMIEDRLVANGANSRFSPAYLKTLLSCTGTVVYELGKDIDAIGLFLVCAGWLLFLLPLNLAKLQTDGWQTSWIIAMLVIGGVLIIAFGFWEVFFSPKPLLHRRWRLNKDVHLATWIGFFDFFSFYLSWTPAYTWIVIVKDFNTTDAGYFSNTQSLCLTVFGIAAGFISLATKQYKWTLCGGALIRILGIGLMIRYRDTVSTTFQVVMPQVLQGLGGGILGVTLQVAAQVSVRHQDVAMVTAYVLLITEIGGACGTAVVGAIQTNVLPGYLDRFLPMLSAAERAAIFASPTSYLATYPLGSPVRDGIVAAYNLYIHKLLIVSICLSVPPVLLSLALTNYRLNDKQNCVSDELAGMSITAPASSKASDESHDRDD
ncbi:uncharacterized protein PFL1_05724 [Pseudozyma flocculosa PF-1]|uniref:Major facilitator superfamily (MFS) profile domain-containing protein n=2 Tax=Pseudozyma flocculosa TaxID=84751 RepID=A0A061H482_9BASI|nr:uncharacterized protein PFL1_05724 [Pseudozyma flocculosa PF-1]EPQ26745.1 hypothetical protein PFL1_05724 [Pseudozyma flocculosa PF-1]SPO40931.1 probable siderophore iron transporter mirC [Pseudozyma flocculosa]